MPRAAGALLGAACLVTALWLASRHPLSPALALAGVGVLAVAQAAWPPLWLVVLPALLPWLGLGAWSGWFVVDEMDLAVLAAAAGGWIGWAWRPWPAVPTGRLSAGLRVVGQVLLAVWSTSVLMAMLQGVQAAGGWGTLAASGWWHGWREAGNALRLAKPTLALLLLLPLWWRVQQRPGAAAAARLQLGMALCLAGLAVWCLWERQVGTGLLNMATDYRTTGPFWESNTGGAALDIALALTLPFALAWAIGRRQPLAMLAAAVLVLGGLYGALTTFSRIVLLAVPLGLLVWAGVARPWSAAAAGAESAGVRPTAAAPQLLGLGLLVGSVAALGAWQFPYAGYRGTLALLGNAVLLLWLVPVSRHWPARRWLVAWLAGLAAAAVLVPAAQLMTKGAYGLYAMALLVSAGALALIPAAGPGRAWAAASAGAAFVVQLAASVAVAVHWGGGPAAAPAGAAAVVLALLWLWAGRHRATPWPLQWRPLVGTATALAGLLTVLSVFLAGQHFSGRLADTAADTDTRGDHFRDGLATMGSGTGFWMGQGLGRFADLYALNARSGQRPGDIRFVHTPEGMQVRMVAGDHPIGDGELLRLSQRVAWPPRTPLTVVLEVRSEVPLQFHADLCVKHLLYAGEDCRMAAVRMPTASQGLFESPASSASGWQTVRLTLPASEFSRQDLLPRLLVFSLGSETPLQPFTLRAVRLLDASGQDWLRNGDFSAGAARWFITSDKHHLPWHAKNLAVHLLVEQGVVGLVVLVLAVLAALAALTGPMRSHPLAGGLAGALAGVLAVGLVDSVLDIPRVATWLLLVLWMALSLHQPSRRADFGRAASGEAVASSAAGQPRP